MHKKIFEMYKTVGLNHFYGDFFDSRFYISYLLSRNPPKKILDIGCGVGILLNAAPECFKVGTDISFNSLKHAKKLNQKIQYVQCDAQFLPFKEECFSTITAMHLFPVINIHGGNWKLAINEVKRIAETNSTVLITGANRTSRHFNKTHKVEDRKKYLRHVEQVKEFEDKFNVTLEGWGPHSKFIMYPFKIIYKIPDLINEKFGIEKLSYKISKSKKYLKNGRSYVIICESIN
jgi:ubiquinone/menaquinone biosynthesis C-methylase UbiE